MYSLSRI